MYTTELEQKLLREVAGHTVTEGDTTVHMCKVGEIGTNEITPRQVPGLIGSLVRKGMLATDGTTVRVTGFGLEATKVANHPARTAKEVKNDARNLIVAAVVDRYRVAEVEHLDPAVIAALKVQVGRVASFLEVTPPQL